MTKCSDIMTEDLVYCMPDDTVMEVARLMKKEDSRLCPRLPKALMLI